MTGPMTDERKKTNTNCIHYRPVILILKIDQGNNVVREIFNRELKNHHFNRTNIDVIIISLDYVNIGIN